MSRADELNKSFEKPAARYLEWSSDDKQLKYYDKETEKNVLVKLPFKFVVLMERHTIKGFNEAKNSGFYSNEVEDLSKEELNVRLFSGGTVAKGLYSELKEKMSDSGSMKGACYAKSIYIQTLDGEIWNIMLKGAAVFAWGEFVKKNRGQLVTHSITITGADELKKGKIEYSIPVFEWGKAMASASAKKADEAYDELINKLSARAQSLASESVKEQKSSGEAASEEEEEDDPFAAPPEADVDF